MHMHIGNDSKNGATVMFLLPGYPFQFSPQNVWLLAFTCCKVAKVNGYVYVSLGEGCRNHYHIYALAAILSGYSFQGAYSSFSQGVSGYET